MDIETLDTIIMGYHQDADDAAGTEAVHYAGVLEAMVQLANVVAEAEGAAADNPAAMRAFREHRVVRTQEAVLEGLYTAAVRHAIYRGDDVSAYLPQAPAASSAAASAAPQPTGFRRFLPWGHSASIPAASQPSAPVAPVISGEAARRYAAARGWPTTVVAAQELAAQIAAEDAAVAATDQNDPE